jgi:hypothetical protein
MLNVIVTQEIVSKVMKILDRIIDENLESLFQNDFKVRPRGLGYEKFYLNHVDGSYDMSLQALIHYILAEEKIYDQILNESQFAKCMKVIKEAPEAIYYPEDDSDEDFEVEELLDYIYYKSIGFTGMRLISMGIDVSYGFKDYLIDSNLKIFGIN